MNVKNNQKTLASTIVNAVGSLLEQQTSLLRQEMAQLGSTLRDEMEQQGETLRDEMRQQGETLRNEMKEQGEILRLEMKQQAEALREEIKHQNEVLRSETGIQIESLYGELKRQEGSLGQKIEYLGDRISLNTAEIHELRIQVQTALDGTVITLKNQERPKKQDKRILVLERDMNVVKKVLKKTV